MKPESCEGCALYSCPGPVLGEFTPGDIDVLFIGEALGAVEVMQHRPMIGPAGQVLRHTIKHTNLERYGITNVWKCRPPNNEVPEGVVPAEFCRRGLLEDLTTHNQKLTVPLGGTALSTISGVDINITAIQGHMFSTSYDGTSLSLLPMFHPSYLRRHGSSWRDWELCWDKLKLYLKTGKSHYIPFSERKVHHVHSSEQALVCLKRVRELAKTHKVMSLDIETSAGYNPWAGARIISVSISWTPTESVAMMWHDVEHFPAFDELKALLEDPDIIWLWYNGQFDTQFLRWVGIEPRIDRDAMLEVHLIDERANVHALKKDSGFFLDAPDWEEDVRKYAPKKTDSYELIPPEKLLEYNGLDTCHTVHLSEVAHGYLSEEGLTWYYENVLAPAYNMLSRSRFVGLRVDLYRVKSLQGEIQPVLDELHQRMVEVIGDSFFNPRSPQQVKAALHSRGLKVINTRKETLEQYAGDELVDAIRDYRDADKILSTYLIGLVEDVYDDLRVHPDWKYPAETGRLRCQDPNLLGIPRKAEIEEHRWKRFVKEVYIADPDTLLMHIDRKQSEVRVVLFLAQAKEFIEHLKKNPSADIHGEFTALIYGPNFTHEERVLIKMVVFGLIYNREAPSLARQFTAIEREKARREGKTKYKVWSIREAQRFIDDFFARMPEVLVWKKAEMKQAMKLGTQTNFLGRIRRYGLINEQTRKHNANEMVNFPVSSLSNDINLLSCVETMKQFGKYGVEVIVPIHDAGLLRIPKDSQSLVDEISGMWYELPTKYLHTDLPFPCDVTIGERWSDL